MSLVKITFVEHKDWKQEALYHKDREEAEKEKEDVVVAMTRILSLNEFELFQKASYSKAMEEIWRQILIAKRQFWIILKH